MRFIGALDSACVLRVFLLRGDVLHAAGDVCWMAFRRAGHLAVDRLGEYRGRNGVLLSWAGLFYSLYLSGLGYQTGFTPWWHWLRGRDLPNRDFRPRSLYLLLRHPVYLSFMGLIWFNPVMTVDRLLLAVVWSGYIIAGSYLKDERLAFFLGTAYRDYQEQVPGYPFMPLGPLARRKRIADPDVIPIRKPVPLAARKAA